MEGVEEVKEIENIEELQSKVIEGQGIDWSQFGNVRAVYNDSITRGRPSLRDAGIGLSA